MATDAPVPTIPEQRIVLDGTTFVGVDTQAMTFAHHIYLEEVLLATGLDDPGQLMSPTEPPVANAKKLLRALYRSDRTFDWLAGVLVEDGKPWSKAAAAANAARFARLTTQDPAAFKQLRDLIAATLFGFFVAGQSSSATSPSSSRSTGAPGSDTRSDPSTSAGAAPSGAADGTPSSADSPASTTTA